MAEAALRNFTINFGPQNGRRETTGPFQPFRCNQT
jgi:hypothetical protein